MHAPTFNIVARTDPGELQTLAPYQRLYIATHDAPTGKAILLCGGWIANDASHPIAALNSQQAGARVFKRIDDCLSQQRTGRGQAAVLLADLREWTFKLPHTTPYANSHNTPASCSQIQVAARTLETEFHDLSSYQRITVEERQLDIGKVTMLCGGWINNATIEPIAFCNDNSDAIACIDVIADAIFKGRLSVDLCQCTYVPSADVLRKLSEEGRTA